MMNLCNNGSDFIEKRIICVPFLILDLKIFLLILNLNEKTMNFMPFLALPLEIYY